MPVVLRTLSCIADLLLTLFSGILIVFLSSTKFTYRNQQLSTKIL